MIAAADIKAPRLGELLRGEREPLLSWIQRPTTRHLLGCVSIIMTGAGLYGAAMGCWRAPLQAGFVAIKFPLIILLTTAGNGLLNAMLAPLLGLNLGLRQSLVAVLLSFTVFSAVLGAFSPIIGFVIWNAPPLVADDWRQTSLVYSGIMLLHVVAIAFGGIAGNLRMLQMLEYFSGQRAVARRVLFAWLAGNLFVGSQLSWILRPFIGSPVLPVEFLRPNAFHGNFYETVFQSFLRVIHP